MITYFIQSGNFVKIGRTSNLQKRIDQLRVGFPQDPKLLNACDMPEKVAHKIASEISKRANGEWFEINPKLLEWIAAIETTNSEMAAFTLKKKTIKAKKPKGKVGRPATGNKHAKLTVSVPIWIVDEAKLMAKENGESLSRFIARAIHEQLYPNDPNPFSVKTSTTENQ